MRRIPDSPPIRRLQVSATPTPSGLTMPSPVTTTLRILKTPAAAPRLRGRVLLQEIDRVFHGQNLLGRVVRDFDTEFFLEGHHQLDRVETVGAQVVDEARILSHLGLF